MKEVKKFIMNKEQQLFVKSAWLLYNNREKILADPRMAYALIEMENILAYVGESFKETTVGAYLEWWHTYERATPTNKQGQPTLVVRFVGSPLSGQNKCQVVTNDGIIEEWWCPRFGSLWEPLIWTNRMFKRNRPANLQPYTLEEVINKLKNEL